MRIQACAAAMAAALLASAPAVAQEAAAAPAAEPDMNAAAEAAAVAETACCLVPARTPVEIEIAEPVGSRASTTGQRFALRLAEPLVVDGRVVAPAGTPGVGEVVHASRARAMGKAGELVLAARYLELNGMRLPLRSLRMGRRQGDDNSTAVIAASMVPLVGMFAPFIAGGEIDVPAGARAHAMTAADTVLPQVE